MKKIAFLVVVFFISTQTIAGNWKTEKLIEPTKNTDAVTYNIFYALEGEKVKDPASLRGAVTEFIPVRRPTVLCVLHMNAYQTSHSCVDIGEPVSIAADVPELLVSDTINRVFPMNVMQAGPYRLIEFTAYSSDKVNCQIVWQFGEIQCY